MVSQVYDKLFVFLDEFTFGRFSGASRRASIREYPTWFFKVLYDILV
jgi:hypothetical protein